MIGITDLAALAKIEGYSYGISVLACCISPKQYVRVLPAVLGFADRKRRLLGTGAVSCLTHQTVHARRAWPPRDIDRTRISQPKVKKTKI